MLDLKQYLAERRSVIEDALDARMPPETTRPQVLHKAMRYSVFAGGKRIRPILCLAAAEALGVPYAAALVPAIAIEALHTYTLIHDDLPCMDDDTLRRGKPTCHVAFGEANAVLAGDALLTLAFEWLAEAQAPPPYPPNQLAVELARAAGSRGVIAGQVEDLAAEGGDLSPENLAYIHSHKTAELIRASVRMGAIAGGAAAEALDALSGFGEDLGLAFQVQDDILNATGTAESLGKAAGTDVDRKKVTFVRMHGLDASKRKAEELAESAVARLLPLGPRAEPLAAIAQFVVRRTS